MHHVLNRTAFISRSTLVLKYSNKQLMNSDLHLTRAFVLVEPWPLDRRTQMSLREVEEGVAS